MNSVKESLHEAVDKLTEEEAQRTLRFVQRLRVKNGNQQSDDEWRTALQDLFANVQAYTSQFSPEEIEADITAAAEEVREARRARRSS